jgi:hypothetical protein
MGGTCNRRVAHKGPLEMQVTADTALGSHDIFEWLERRYRAQAYSAGKSLDEHSRTIFKLRSARSFVGAELRDHLNFNHAHATRLVWTRRFPIRCAALIQTGTVDVTVILVCSAVHRSGGIAGLSASGEFCGREPSHRPRQPRQARQARTRRFGRTRRRTSTIRRATSPMPSTPRTASTSPSWTRRLLSASACSAGTALPRVAPRPTGCLTNLVATTIQTKRMCASWPPPPAIRMTARQMRTSSSSSSRS